MMHFGVGLLCFTGQPCCLPTDVYQWSLCFFFISTCSRNDQLEGVIKYTISGLLEKAYMPTLLPFWYAAFACPAVNDKDP